MKIASHTDEFSFFDFEIANRRKFIIFLSFLKLKRKEGRKEGWGYRIISAIFDESQLVLISIDG